MFYTLDVRILHRVFSLSSGKLCRKRVNGRKRNKTDFWFVFFSLYRGDFSHGRVNFTFTVLSSYVWEFFFHPFYIGNAKPLTVTAPLGKITYNRDCVPNRHKTFDTV